MNFQCIRNAIQCLKVKRYFNNIEVICSDLLEKDGYYTINFEDFEEKAKDKKVTLCIFCNPHNPSGRVWSEEELQSLRFQVAATDYLLLHDSLAS